MTAKKKAKLTYEQGMETLEGLIDKLGEGKLSLEESMKTYEQGMELAAQLAQMLEEHRMRIEKIDPETAEIAPLEGE